MRSIISLMVIACLLAVCVGSARADDDKQDGSKAKAGEYFAKGSGLFDSGEFARAAASFLLAYELAPHPMVLANIAMSYDKAGNIAKAIEYYEKYAASLKKKKERKKIKKRLKELSAMVGELLVECPAASCRIEVDTIDRGNAPVHIVVDIGLHRVEAFDGDDKIDGLIFGRTQLDMGRKSGREQGVHTYNAGIPEETAQGDKDCKVIQVSCGP